MTKPVKWYFILLLIIISFALTSCKSQKSPTYEAEKYSRTKRPSDRPDFSVPAYSVTEVPSGEKISAEETTAEFSSDSSEKETTIQTISSVETECASADAEDSFSVRAVSKDASGKISLVETKKTKTSPKATTKREYVSEATTKKEYVSEATTKKDSVREPAIDRDNYIYTGALSNPYASTNASMVYSYLKECNGKYCITGQMEAVDSYVDFHSYQYEVRLIENSTGKLPAILGLDFRKNEFTRVVARAKEWWEMGGIPTICWHTGIDFSSGYTESVCDELDWEKALTPGTEEYNALIEGMDQGAVYLKQLEQAGVPVLWRPFHEVYGGWFWWNRGGAENFRKLWKLMYTRYTDYWQLDNLIWVLGYCSHECDMAAWYPGDAYVDVIGIDCYSPGAHGGMYQACYSLAPAGMPVVYHECATIPTEQEMKDEGAPWCFFMEWYTSLDANYSDNTEALNAIYNSDFFITLDELPFK